MRAIQAPKLRWRKQIISYGTPVEQDVALEYKAGVVGRLSNGHAFDWNRFGRQWLQASIIPSFRLRE